MENNKKYTVKSNKDIEDLVHEVLSPNVPVVEETETEKEKNGNTNGYGNNEK